MPGHYKKTAERAHCCKQVINKFFATLTRNYLQIVYLFQMLLAQIQAKRWKTKQQRLVQRLERT